MPVMPGCRQMRDGARLFHRYGTKQARLPQMLQRINF
jgi:hypothetical protein